MFRKIFALALVLILVAICTRRPIDGPLGGKLPNTCASSQVAAAVADFSDLAAQRDAALARIEALPIEEPAEYVRVWQAEIAKLKDLAATAQAAGLPRCLAHAQELFVLYLAQSGRAAEQRRPEGEGDFADYRRALETADVIRGQYAAEVKLQEKNRQ